MPERQHIALQLMGQIGDNVLFLYHKRLPTLIDDKTISRQFVQGLYERISDQKGPFHLNTVLIPQHSAYSYASGPITYKYQGATNSFDAFAAVYSHAVEDALFNPETVEVYTDGTMLLKHPAGFHAMYRNPEPSLPLRDKLSHRGTHAAEQMNLVVPAELFDTKGIYDMHGVLVYGYRTNLPQRTGTVCHSVTRAISPDGSPIFTTKAVDREESLSNLNALLSYTDQPAWNSEQDIV